MTKPSAQTVTPRIRLAYPNVGREELNAVREVLESGVLSMGQFTEAFESAVAATNGRQYGVACSSGTAGLHMAVRGLGVSEGDEVITTPFSFVASANCILYERATPRFVDIEEETLGLDPELVSAAASDKTVAILPVDVFGHPCRLIDLEHLADDRGWRFIEDSCEALGSSLAGRPAGGFGDAAVFAFYPNKQITTGEGGAVVTDDAELARNLRSMRNQGRDEDGTWLNHVQLGWNYRLDELSAALGLTQLRRYDELRAGRARVARSYASALAGVDWLRLPSAMPDADVDWFVFVVRLDEDIDRDRLIIRLHDRGVPARPYFVPLHLQPLYRGLYGYRPGDYPVTERVASATLALPFSSLMTDSEVDFVASVLVDEVRSRPSGHPA